MCLGKGNPRNEVALVMRKEGLAYRKKILGYHLARQQRRCQAVAGGENQSAEQQQINRKALGLCVRDEQA